MTVENIVLTPFSHYNLIAFHSQDSSIPFPPQPPPSVVPQHHTHSQRHRLHPHAGHHSTRRYSRAQAKMTSNMASNEDEMAEFQARSDDWRPDVQVRSSRNLPPYGD